MTRYTPQEFSHVICCSLQTLALLCCCSGANTDSQSSGGDPCPVAFTCTKRLWATNLLVLRSLTWRISAVGQSVVSHKNHLCVKLLNFSHLFAWLTFCRGWLVLKCIVHVILNTIVLQFCALPGLWIPMLGRSLRPPPGRWQGLHDCTARALLNTQYQNAL